MAASYAVRDLTGTADYVRFETPDIDYTIYRNGHTQSHPIPTVSIGAITGTIQTLRDTLNKFAAMWHSWDGEALH